MYGWTASKDLRNHLVQEFLDSPNKTKFSDALTDLGIVEVEDLVSMNPTYVEDLKTKTVSGNITETVPFDVGRKSRMNLFLKWIAIKKLEAVPPITAEFWQGLDCEEIITFQTMYVHPKVAPPGALGHHANTNSLEFKQKQEIDNFKQSIKRDTSVYPTLQDDLHWDS